jgi:methylated-DNA-[protein]-cysteine S-methyltransferase
MCIAFYESPLGTIKIAHSSKGVTSLIFLENKPEFKEIPEILIPVILQLDEYFTGKRTRFDLNFDLIGTDFQRQVWEALLEIPFGQTVSYMDLAKKLGDPKTIRAVGNANGKNPVSIFVPCHRVVGTDSSLTGYAGGLWRKEWLLNHEKKFKQLSLF